MWSVRWSICAHPPHEPLGRGRDLGLELADLGLEHADPGAQRCLEQLAIAVGRVATAMTTAQRYCLALRIQKLTHCHQSTATLLQSHAYLTNSLSTALLRVAAGA